MRKAKQPIVFVHLPAYLDGVARLLSKGGCAVYYGRLTGVGRVDMPREARAEKLRLANVLPLSLEQASTLPGIYDVFKDETSELDRFANTIAPERLREHFASLFPNNNNMVRKLHAVVKLIIGAEYFTLNPINLWAATMPNVGVVAFYPSMRGILVCAAHKNVRVLVLPLDEIFYVVGYMFRVTTRLLGKAFRRRAALVSNVAGKTSIDSPTSRANVAFVPHGGLAYGNLFDKTLYYSEDPSSDFHQSKVLHLDYSGVNPPPGSNLLWVSLTRPQSGTFGIRNILVGLGCALPAVRSPRAIVGALLLVRLYSQFKVYLHQLQPYSELRLALIDYEVLCPKSLLLAFESQKIHSIGTQERFILPCYVTTGTLLDTYLCASEYMVRTINGNTSYQVGETIPVGQYRTDVLLGHKSRHPPAKMEQAIAEGKKIVTALGFHTRSSWFESNADPLLNWSAHRSFIEDMLQLADALPNIFIILRYKNIDWVGLPAFDNVLARLEEYKNVKLSDEYDTPFYSYELCAHSDLVIAKHTSLGDECLAIGIPVLFHDFTHNSDRIVAGAFDYDNGGIMCSSNEVLLARAKAVLYADYDEGYSFPNYDKLKSKYYGDFGDGKARSRILIKVQSQLDFLRTVNEPDIRC